MASKENPGKFDCYNNALPDEPIFVLLARDPEAPGLVHRWAYGREDMIARGERPASDRAMVEEAHKCAEDMRAWRERNDGKWRK